MVQIHAKVRFNWTRRRSLNCTIDKEGEGEAEDHVDFRNLVNGWWYLSTRLMNVKEKQKTMWSSDIWSISGGIYRRWSGNWTSCRPQNRTIDEEWEAEDHVDFRNLVNGWRYLSTRLMNDKEKQKRMWSSEIWSISGGIYRRRSGTWTRSMC